MNEETRVVQYHVNLIWWLALNLKTGSWPALKVKLKKQDVNWQLQVRLQWPEVLVLLLVLCAGAVTVVLDDLRQCIYMLEGKHGNESTRLLEKVKKCGVWEQFP